MALGDKVEQLQVNVATLTERLDHVRVTQKAAHNDLQTTISQLAERLRELEQVNDRRGHEIDELKRWKDDRKKQDEERSRRLWAFGPNIVGAVVSGLIAAVVAYFVARH
jgi:hypothetical protein